MIIAQTRNSDSSSETDLDLVVALRECPAAGDTIKLKDHRTVMVTRRQFIELDPDNPDDKIDVVLSVRISN